MAEQVWRLTPSCTGGGKEAEPLLLQALRYRKLSAWPWGDAEALRPLYQFS